MDKKEFAQFAMALKTYYPKEQLLPNNQAMELWYRQLQDIPYKVAEVALNKWVAINKWSPTIADIREVASTVQMGDIPDWGDGWEQVLKAVSHFGMYEPQKALASMDDITRQCVERIGFRNICLSENIAADRANFRTLYEQLAQRKKQNAQLPKALTQMISTMRVGMIEGGNGND